MDIKFRQATRADLPAMKVLYQAAIEGLCQNDYSLAQREMWSASVNKTERWEKLIEEQWVLLAWHGQTLAGFLSLLKADYIDFLYVNPHYAGRGIASLLLEKLKLKADTFRAHYLETDASITARPFFESRGFRLIRENKNQLGTEILINYRMRKTRKKNPD